MDASDGGKHSTKQHYTALHSTTQHYTALYLVHEAGRKQARAAEPIAKHKITTKHSITQHYAVPHSTTQHENALHSIPRP
jgi:hypothetical protein